MEEAEGGEWPGRARDRARWGRGEPSREGRAGLRAGEGTDDRGHLHERGREKAHEDEDRQKVDGKKWLLLKQSVAGNLTHRNSSSGHTRFDPAQTESV